MRFEISDSCLAVDIPHHQLLASYYQHQLLITNKLMPELPEVETTIRELSPKIIGKKIVNFWTDTPKIIKSPRLSIFEKEILGKKIVGLERRGKNILIRLEGNTLLLVHQKLTGHLLYGLWKKEGDH